MSSNSVTRDPAVSRNSSFSIENILLKPDRLPQPPQLMTIFPGHGQPSNLKPDYAKEFCDENGNIDENGMDDGRSERSETRSFTTPDSSCCDDAEAEDMCDEAEENRKFQTLFWKSINATG